MQANAPTDDLELTNLQQAEYQDLSSRLEMSDRRTFLETIKEIASSIKKLLDATNAVMQVVHPSAQLCINFGKSADFSNNAVDKNDKRKNEKG
ncbi:unnamed protein product [Gongylonema pulchrum]|uniref:Uncharacterized protein n=1 Tax=Gongylonema pulchrum TaxID=637853 RepID=A0A183DVU0_9BILA|nr:unnamed protein product [Gongylonema pulchrum]